MSADTSIEHARKEVFKSSCWEKEIKRLRL